MPWCRRVEPNLAREKLNRERVMMNFTRAMLSHRRVKLNCARKVGPRVRLRFFWERRGKRFYPTGANFKIVFPDAVANSVQVWACFERRRDAPQTALPAAHRCRCAAWVSRRGETGPVGAPITTNIQGGVSSAPAMKIAA